MSWIHQLCRTYDNIISSPDALNDENILLPICHTTLSAHIEIVVDDKGNFKTATIVPKNPKSISRTIVPCTEESGGRTSGTVAHPLTDNLTYVSDDLKDHIKSSEKIDEETIDKLIEKNEHGHKDYVNKLKSWAEKSSLEPLKAIYNYVSNNNICNDLIKIGILPADNNNKFSIEADGSDAEIYSVVTGTIDKAVVRWVVEKPGEPSINISSDQRLWNEWINYYLSSLCNKGICMVTGKEEALLTNHPSKIRNEGDKAKLISSNDATEYKYRGRFLVSNDAYSLGYESSHKAHNALRWLIRRQGFHVDTWCEVSWSVNGNKIISPTRDNTDVFSDLSESDGIAYDSGKVLADRINKMLVGYHGNIDDDQIVTMIVDSATPGRLSIVYYKAFKGSTYEENIVKWYSTCSWPRNYYVKNEESGKFIQKMTVLPPSLFEIIKLAYGDGISNGLMKSTLNRLIPCVIDGMPFPKDISTIIIHNASSPEHFDNEIRWETTLSVACALYRKINTKEEYEMTLDKERKSRDYLYGRLLAIADHMEGRALYMSNESRQTNAMRLMQKFAERPYSTWRNIDLSLSPYRARLGQSSYYYDSMIAEIMEMFDSDAFISDKKLSGEFLLGFYTQRTELKKKKEGE